METEGYPEMQRDGDVQNDEIRSPSNERMTEEPKKKEKKRKFTITEAKSM